MKRKLLICLAGIAAAAAMILPIKAAEPSFDCWFSYPGSHSADDARNDYYAFQGSSELVQTVWKDETVFFKIAVRAEQDTTLYAEVSGLKQAEAEVCHLEDIRTSMGIGLENAAPVREIPDLVVPGSELTLTAGKTGFFWLRIHIPAGASAGKEQGIITIRDAGGSQKECRLTLQILPLSLPEERAYSVNLWQYPYVSLQYYDCLQGQEPFSAGHVKELRQELELYRETGGNAVTVTVVPEPWGHQTYYDTPSMVVWHRHDDGYYSFDFSLLEQWVKLCEKCGINGRIDTYSPLPWDGSVTVIRDDQSEERLFLTPGTYNWTAAWEAFLYAYMDVLEKNGWFDRTYLCLDERDAEAARAVLDLVGNVRNSSGQSFRVSVAVNRWEDVSLYDLADDISISLTIIPKDPAQLQEVLSRRHSMRRTTTLYNCTATYPSAFTCSEPDETIWMFDYLSTSGFTGYLRWALDAWNDNPYMDMRDRNFEAGDSFMIYPDRKDAADPRPCRSLRTEMIIAGSQRAEKLKILGERYPQLRQDIGMINRPSGQVNAWGAMTGTDTAAAAVTEEVMLVQELMAQYEEQLADPWKGKTKSRHRLPA